jgi:hypothetical protein
MGPTLSTPTLVRQSTDATNDACRSTRFDARHHDGVAAVRDFAWSTACGCFRYTGALRPVS